MMRTLFCLCIALMPVMGMAQRELLGKSEADLIAAKGDPSSKVAVGGKAIYRWPDMEVALIDGKVTSANPRDPQKEHELRQWSAQRRAQEKEKAAPLMQKIKEERELNAARASIQEQIDAGARAMAPKGPVYDNHISDSRVKDASRVRDDFASSAAPVSKNPTAVHSKTTMPGGAQTASSKPSDSAKWGYYPYDPRTGGKPVPRPDPATVKPIVTERRVSGHATTQADAYVKAMMQVPANAKIESVSYDPRERSVFCNIRYTTQSSP